MTKFFKICFLFLFFVWWLIYTCFLLIYILQLSDVRFYNDLLTAAWCPPVVMTMVVVSMNMVNVA